MLTLNRDNDRGCVPYVMALRIPYGYHIVIGQQVYDALDDGQKSMHKHLKINSDVWNYVSSSTGGNIYKAYTDK
jgi:hypothetical protein